MKGYIYQIRNTVNGKLYIGQSVDYKRRWWQHRDHFKKGIKHNPHFTRAYEKYGADAFEYSLIDVVPVHELDDAEIKYIAMYDTTNPEKGYNVTEGGSGGSRDAIRELVGRRVARYDMKTGALVQAYDCGIDVEEDGFAQSHVNAICNGKDCMRTHKGFIWEFYNGQQRVAPFECYQDPSTFVSQYTLEGEHIRTYKMVKDVADYGYEPNKVSQALNYETNGTNNVYEGFVWAKGERLDFIQPCGEPPKRLIQYTLEGEPIAEYKSLTQAGKGVGVHHETIRRNVLGTKDTILDRYVFRWYEGFEPLEEIPYLDMLFAVYA